MTTLGPSNCHHCGVGLQCEDGAVIARHGRVDEITLDMIPDLSKQPKALARAREMGRVPSERLSCR